MLAGTLQQPRSNFYSRTYDPNIGQFFTEDPIGFKAGDTNLHRYVGNDPMNNTDPYGIKI